MFAFCALGQSYSEWTNPIAQIKTKTKKCLMQSYEFGKQTCQKTKQIASRIFQGGSNAFQIAKELPGLGAVFVKNHSLYKRYITPISLFDYGWMGVGTSLQGLITFISFKRFGMISLYFNAFSSALWVAVMLSILAERRKYFFSNEICEILNKLQELIGNITCMDPKKAEIQQCINQLNASKFENYKNQREEIKKEIEKFNSVTECFELERNFFCLLNQDQTLQDELNKEKKSLDMKKIQNLLSDLNNKKVTKNVKKLLSLPSLNEEKDKFISLIQGMISSISE